jgi:hypothetical protein
MFLQFFPHFEQPQLADFGSSFFDAGATTSPSPVSSSTT